MGSCFSKKQSSELNSDKTSFISNRRHYRSCTPEINVLKSIEILIDENGQEKLKEGGFDKPVVPSAKLVINNIHRTQKPRNDAGEVLEKINRARLCVEKAVKVKRARRSPERFKKKKRVACERLDVV